MKQPFWIFNSILFTLFITILLFIFFARVNIPKKQSIEPYAISQGSSEPEKIDLEQIYKNDLFNTFKSNAISQVREAVQLMPNPPVPVEPHIPEVAPPQFFDALPITLTGIIILEDESKNQAIIMDNKTQQQVNYRVGDEIEDAQLIRILKNKIILVRSNGQQEVLYLRQEDAKIGNPLNRSLLDKDIVKKITNELYFIDPVKFTSYIKNLGELIESFNLSTAYKQGRSIGSIILELPPDSLALQMGLMPGDIIHTINGITTDNHDSQVEIYEKIINLKENDVILVELLRNESPIKIEYKLKKMWRKGNHTKIASIESKIEVEKIEENKIEAEKVKILKEKYKFAPTIEEIKLREKQGMFKRKNLEFNLA